MVVAYLTFNDLFSTKAPELAVNGRATSIHGVIPYSRLCVKKQQPNDHYLTHCIFYILIELGFKANQHDRCPEHLLEFKDFNQQVSRSFIASAFLRVR